MVYRLGLIASVGPWVCGIRLGRDSTGWPYAVLSSIGLMSGTSYDGVDVALINQWRGDRPHRPTLYRPYNDESACSCGTRWRLGRQTWRIAPSRPGLAADCRGAGDAGSHAEAVEAFLAAIGMAASDSRWSASTARPCCTIRAGI